MCTVRQRLALILPLALTPMLASPAYGNTRMPDDAEVHCMALALYFEAKGEGMDGMAAVAAVVLNRARHPEFPDEICGVIKDGGEQPPCQFSWWCDGKSDRPSEANAWLEARKVARDALTGRVVDRTRGALFFHNTGMSNPWHRLRQRTAQIGRHIFYR